MRWYQTMWGVALLGLGGLVLVGAIIFSAITIKFWWQIKHGQGDLLQQQVYGGFDRDPKAVGHEGETVDRKVLETGDFPFLGNPNASTTIVVFGDFRCPYTREEWPILQKLVNIYGYKIKLIFRNFPAESIHPGTTKLAQIGACAQAQGKYWNTHNYLFASQEVLPIYLSASDITAFANQTDLNLAQLNKCLDSSVTAIKVNRDYADGYRFGVEGTPTFFVNGQKVEGVVPFEVWENYIKAL
jgi:protein-disulfide isomerase